jgi:hypothetical protein
VTSSLYGLIRCHRFFERGSTSLTIHVLAFVYSGIRVSCALTKVAAQTSTLLGHLYEWRKIFSHIGTAYSSGRSHPFLTLLSAQ